MPSAVTMAATGMLALTLMALAAVGRPSAAGDLAADASMSPAVTSAPPLRPTAARQVNLSQPFTLVVSESVQIADALVIRFEAVTEDSRCPADVVCVWEGNAQVSLAVGAPSDETAALTLDSNSAFSNTADLPGYTIRLVRLEPYPKIDVELPEPYRATLLVVSRDADS